GPAAWDQVERSYAPRDPRRDVEARRNLDDAVPEADVLRPLAGGRKEHLGGARVRVLLEEVVLDLPDVVDPDLVRELDLLERVGQELLLGALGPRARQLVLVEDPESHGVAPLEVRSGMSRSGGARSNSGRRVPSGRRRAIEAIPSATIRRPSSSTARSSSSSRRRRSGRMLSAITPVQAPHMNFAARKGSTGRATPVLTPSSMIDATLRTPASARSARRWVANERSSAPRASTGGKARIRK